MEQYQQSGKIQRIDTTAKPTTEVLNLQNQVYHLQNTVELQSRQIRRLESALQLLESQVNSRVR